MISKVGIVVPTLGTRPEYLRQCLLSIREAGPAFVLLITKEAGKAKELQAEGLVDSIVSDPGKGLPEAINLGIEKLPREVEYINWLGDDDLLTQGSLLHSATVLDNEPKTVLVFGSCDYVDERGDVVWKNKSGSWAVPLMRVGPDLIPQPGALFRREAFTRAGKLKSEYEWAFDFDLFIELSKVGKLKFLNQTLAQFRWHPESLSVEFRKNSVSEASQVRVHHLPKLLRPISVLWEYPVRQATLIAGMRVTAKAHSKARSR